MCESGSLTISTLLKSLKGFDDDLMCNLDHTSVGYWKLIPTPAGEHRCRPVTRDEDWNAIGFRRGARKMSRVDDLRSRLVELRRIRDALVMVKESASPYFREVRSVRVFADVKSGDTLALPYSDRKAKTLDSDECSYDSDD
jgi:hypothetical protein